MKNYRIELGTHWSAVHDGRNVTVRSIHVEDGETFIWYGYYGTDTQFECSPEEFARRFVRLGENVS